MIGESPVKYVAILSGMISVGRVNTAGMTSVDPQGPETPTNYAIWCGICLVLGVVLIVGGLSNEDTVANVVLPIMGVVLLCSSVFYGVRWARSTSDRR